MSSEIQNQIEAILFASGKGVSVSDLSKFCDVTEKEIIKNLKNLQKDYDEKDSSLHISSNEDKWKLTVRGKYVPYIEKLVSETELSQSILKTLAVVAFKSPVLQSEVVDMRGQSAYEHIKRLIKDKFVTKEEHGRSFILKITDKFYNYFDVEGDEEIREVFSKLKETQEKKLGELEVIDVEENSKIKTQEKNNQMNLLNLEIVDVTPVDDDSNDDLFSKEKHQEEKEEEKEKQKEFLSDIDKKIEEISKRMNNTEIDEKSKEDVDELEDEDKTTKEEDTDLEKLESFADENQQKNNKEEDFL
ncbi:MAG: SMC-Scp complex subunit ScpB [Candidatus Woesearchaeota archaeon]